MLREYFWLLNVIISAGQISETAFTCSLITCYQGPKENLMEYNFFFFTHEKMPGNEGEPFKLYQNTILRYLR